MTSFRFRQARPSSFANLVFDGPRPHQSRVCFTVAAILGGWLPAPCGSRNASVVSIPALMKPTRRQVRRRGRSWSRSVRRPAPKRAFVRDTAVSLDAQTSRHRSDCIAVRARAVDDGSRNCNHGIVHDNRRLALRAFAERRRVRRRSRRLSRARLGVSLPSRTAPAR